MRRTWQGVAVVIRIHPAGDGDLFYIAQTSRRPRALFGATQRGQQHRREYSMMAITTSNSINVKARLDFDQTIGNRTNVSIRTQTNQGGFATRQNTSDTQRHDITKIKPKEFEEEERTEDESIRRARKIIQS